LFDEQVGSKLKEPTEMEDCIASIKLTGYWFKKMK